MKRNSVYIISGVAILAAGFAFFSLNTPSKRVETPIQVRWLISHQPSEVFVRAAVVFADELRKESNGGMELSVVTPQDIGVSSGDIPNAEVFRYLNEGKVELATTYTVALGSEDPALWGLNLPFLFKSYDTAGRALDGEAGRSILNTIHTKTTARGLAFTMSGGFRIIASKNTRIESVADLKGKRIATSGGPVAQATLEALGAIPVPTDLESSAPGIDAKTIDGIETTYSRLSSVLGSETQYTKYINETNHSLFLTVILANDSFYDSLSEANQKAIQKAALAAAAVEREDSIALGEKTRAGLKAQGSTVTTLSAATVQAMQTATQPVYDRFETVLGKDIIQKMLGQQ